MQSGALHLGSHTAAPVLDCDQRRLLIDGRPAHLGSRAFDLLVTLVEQNDRVVGKKELMQAVWPGLVVEDNNLQVQVMALRRLLGSDVITTVTGRGYRYTGPLHTAAVNVKGFQGADGAKALLGRDAMLTELQRMLNDPTLRWVTLTGAGGAGKTSLARRLARDLRGHGSGRFGDGVHFIEFAALTDAAASWPALAAALSLTAVPGMPMVRRVQEYLANRRLLLVLDNLEQMRGAGEALQTLLNATQGVSVLATSRVRLGSDREVAVEVPPLALLEPVQRQSIHTPQSAEQLKASPSVALFLRCASEGGQIVADAELPIVGQVCRRLGGLPLAIELAAAQLRVLTPKALADRLDRSLPMLRRCSADLPARQQSLHATLAWSFDLLDSSSQCLLARLGVCAGGFDIDLAEALDDDPGQTVQRLQQLLDHHLVRRGLNLGMTPRYDLLEPIREFALEQLARTEGGARLARQRHATQLARIHHATQRQLRSADRPLVLPQLRAERENLRAALQWALPHDPESEPESETDRLARCSVAARLVGDAAWWWYFDDAADEAVRWTQRCLLHMPCTTTVARLQPLSEQAPQHHRVLLASARALVHAGAVAEAAPLAAQAAAMAATAGDRNSEGEALLLEGMALLVPSPQVALQRLKRCQAIFRTDGTDWDLALATGVTGMVHAWQPGQEQEATRWLLEARSRCLVLGDPWLLSTTTHHLALITQRQGDLQAARAHAAETLEAARSARYDFLAAGARHQLARIALAEGDDEIGMAWIRDSICDSWQQGRQHDVLLHCRWLGGLLARRGQTDMAVTLLAAGADRFNDNVALAATLMTAEDRAEWHSAREQLRSSMSPDDWDLAWRKALATPLDQALARAGIVLS